MLIHLIARANIRIVSKESGLKFTFSIDITSAFFNPLSLQTFMVDVKISPRKKGELFS